MKCIATIVSLQQAPSRLRLSVRQPRRGCLPWWPKRRTVATLCFKEAHWQQGASGEYEQTVQAEMKDLAKLRRLEADLPVKVKYWIKGRPSKELLQISLGALLDQLEASPAASEAWLAFTATDQEQRVCWQPAAQHQDCADADPALSDDDGLEDLADPPMEYDDLWDSEGEETPLEEDLAPAPCVAEDSDGADEEWVTFFNPSTGKTLRLPRHTEEEEAARWRCPGAWTSEDDLLCPRALRIVEAIQPAVKRTQLPEGPHWWELGSTGTAAPSVTSSTQRAKEEEEEEEEENTGLLTPEWNSPAFPGCSAASHRCSEAEAGLPMVILPAPHPCDGAEAGLPEVALPTLCSTGLRPRAFLRVAAGLIYVIYVTWVVLCGDDFFDAVVGWISSFWE